LAGRVSAEARLRTPNWQWFRFDTRSKAKFRFGTSAVLMIETLKLLILGQVSNSPAFPLN